jgi:hypothetical protein
MTAAREGNRQPGGRKDKLGECSQKFNSQNATAVCIGSEGLEIVFRLIAG